MPKQHRLQIRLFRRPVQDFGPRSQPTLFGRLKVILGGVLLASVVTALLILVVLLGSALVAVIGLVLAVAVAAMLILATVRKARR